LLRFWQPMKAQTIDRGKLVRGLQRESLARFVRDAWAAIEPGTPYVHGWHIDAICQHLEAVTRGDLRRLIINVPPGTMKSLLTAVFWPAWLWGPRGQQHLRIMATSYSERLALRDNLRCRRLVQSPWYQRRWPLSLQPDQNAKGKFELTGGGHREAVPFTSLTGNRADLLVIDDPLSREQAESAAHREQAAETFLESVPTRLNSPDESAIVIIMQRLHERDTTGLALAKGLGYEVLCLPMEYEPERACRTSIGFRDPRSQPGELLFPARYSPETLAGLRASLGAYGWAGQMQQRPAPREGGLFKLADLPIVDKLPEGPVQWVRRWDTASTEGAGDYTAGCLMARVGGRYYIADMARLQGSPAQVEAAMRSCAQRDGKLCRIGLPKDPGAAGVIALRYLTAALAGYVVQPQAETGSKLQRAEPLASQAQAGNVMLMRGPWNQAFIDEACVFPNGAHDDQVDAASGAFAMLCASPAVALSTPSG
jgi:predicted phage terminase large subunit-like protein